MHDTRRKREEHGLFGPQNQLAVYFPYKKQLPFSSFIKHFEVREQQGKCGPKSDFLCWFYCFFVKEKRVTVVSVNGHLCCTL